MTDEKKKKLEEDEVSDEQLEGVAGGTSNVGGVGGVTAQQQYQHDGLTPEQTQQKLQLFSDDTQDTSGTSEEVTKQRTFIRGT